MASRSGSGSDSGGYEAAVQATVAGGGCNASRAHFVGAVTAAAAVPRVHAAAGGVMGRREEAPAPPGSDPDIDCGGLRIELECELPRPAGIPGRWAQLTTRYGEMAALAERMCSARDG